MSRVERRVGLQAVLWPSFGGESSDADIPSTIHARIRAGPLSCFEKSEGGVHGLLA